MRFSLLTLLLLRALLPATYAQMGLNSPAGVTPRQDMEIYTCNGFLVQRKYSIIMADANASINTINCAVQAPEITAAAGIMKDPGGDSDYPASLSCTQGVISTGATAYEIVFEDLDTEPAGDQVLISDFYGNSLPFSGSTLPAPFFGGWLTFVRNVPPYFFWPENQLITLFYGRQ